MRFKKRARPAIIGTIGGIGSPIPPMPPTAMESGAKTGKHLRRLKLRFPRWSYAFVRISTFGALAEGVISAAEALRAARAAGITVVLDGEALLLEAEAEPPRALLDALLRHKQAILDLLRPEQRRWSTDQWRAYFRERCMIDASSGGTRCRAIRTTDFS